METKMNGPERQKGEREKLRAAGVCCKPLGGWVGDCDPSVGS